MATLDDAPLVTKVQDKLQWALNLDKYQRDNLLFLLNLCGAGGTKEPKLSTDPFNIMNTGDWLGEIVWMLGKPAREDGEKTWKYTIDGDDTPNITKKELDKRLRMKYGVNSGEHAYLECSHHGICWVCGKSYNEHKSSVKQAMSVQCHHKVI